MSQSTLYVVATPIGNLEDISARAIRILAEVDLVAAEDTRHTRRLLQHFGIETPTRSVHEHNEEKVLPSLVARLQAGGTVALVSDAGTPLISDPGYRLVGAAAAAGIEVVAVPGPSALLAALSVAGLPTDRFAFEGFLAHKSSARKKQLSTLADEPRTLVFYESSHRILDLVADIGAVFGADRELAVCRELTKRFETVYRGVPSAVAAMLSAGPEHQKGEFVVVVAGSDEVAGGGTDALVLARALREHLPASQAARVAAACTGESRRTIYSALEAGSGADD